MPWWNKTLTVAPASADDAHRKLEKQHDLAAILSFVETRQVHNDYTVHFESKIYQIERKAICAGLRGAAVRVERRWDGCIAVRFRDRATETSQGKKIGFIFASKEYLEQELRVEKVAQTLASEPEFRLQASGVDVIPTKKEKSEAGQKQPGSLRV